MLLDEHLVVLEFSSREIQTFRQSTLI